MKNYEEIVAHKYSFHVVFLEHINLVYKYIGERCKL